MPARLLLSLLLLGACAGDKEGETGDTGEGVPEDTRDIAEQLADVPGVTSVTEFEATTEGTRFFLVGFTQPVDHDDPDGATFTQAITIVHRDRHAPTVMDTRGYAGSYGGGDNELSNLLFGNRLSVEHRYFGYSVPEDPNWDLLRVRQAAADHHAVVEALRPLYDGPWLATGTSKGGETALFFRALYPDDVDGTVAYVAPFVQGLEDTGFDAFFDEVGDADCRADLVTMQRTLLTDMEPLLPSLEAAATEAGESFSIVGAEFAFQVSVSELPWTFWQYSGDCSALPPDPTDGPGVWAWFLASAGSPLGYADSDVEYYSPYFYQCAAELGYPAISNDDIADLLTVDTNDLGPLLPSPTAPTYDPSTLTDIASWLQTDGSELLLIYGAQDPWTARALTLDGEEDRLSFTAPNANHGAQIASLSEEDRATALDALSRWTGVPLSGVSTPGARRAWVEDADREGMAR